MIELYVFDCDGVIIDSAADLADGVNEMLSHFSLPRLPEETLVSFVGNGARKLVERAVRRAGGRADADVEEMLRWYVAFYEAHPVRKTTLYPGIRALLGSLKAKGRKVAMLTNKPSKIASEILETLGVAEFFDSVAGPELVPNPKPSPDGLSYTLSLLNGRFSKEMDARNVVMVGDSCVDVQTGRAFGCMTVGITGGIGDTAALLAERPDVSLGLAADLGPHIDFLSRADALDADSLRAEFGR